MSTHNICFYGKLEKIIPELSLNAPLYQVPCPLKGRKSLNCQEQPVLVQSNQTSLLHT